MGSFALAAWQTVAAERLDQLQAIHSKATGAGPGRRWQTAELNRSLFVALVAQFQGFCRGLHDAAIQVHVDAAAERQKNMLRVLLTNGRKLDVGNPRPSALGSDFGRFEITLIPLLKEVGPRTQRRLVDLDTLVDFRNAIGHGDESRIAAIEAAGRVRATKSHFDRNRRMLGALAVTMDAVVAGQLEILLGLGKPW